MQSRPVEGHSESNISESHGFYETVRREMRLRNYSHKTIKSYMSGLRAFAKYVHPRHPREISSEGIKEFLLYLIDGKHFSASTVNQVFNALRFLYVDLYKMPFKIGDIPRPVKERKLPAVLSKSKVLKIFNEVA